MALRSAFSPRQQILLIPPSGPGRPAPTCFGASPSVKLIGSTNFCHGVLPEHSPYRIGRSPLSSTVGDDYWSGSPPGAER
jgi:hypothetical protein